MKGRSLIICLVFVLAACGGLKYAQFEKQYGPTGPVDRRVNAYKSGELSYKDDVMPVLTNRCDACHSCYDAPCQLKMTSFEGIERGGSKELVYNGARLIPTSPTRLFIDANSPEEWREKGFHPVLNERGQTPLANTENSLLYLMLQLKKENPLPAVELLPTEFDISLDRKQECTPVEEFQAFKNKYPLWGMPYALPGISEEKHNVIVDWLKQGARIIETPEISRQAVPLIKKWETFFNRDSIKQKLVSRYIYEHLFIAHIYFDSLPNREFYRLVRSLTPPGEPVVEINTTRPYDDPEVEEFYYRFRRVKSTIVVKNHTVYTLSDQKLTRYHELFFKPEYPVESLPSYDPASASNPIKTFAAIPAKSRYRFLLDNAQFFVMGFIKGPVCRGQIALSVINDHFFIVFFDPEKDKISNDSEFLAQVSGHLKLPAEKENTIQMGSIWYDFYRNQKKYLDAKEEYLEKLNTDNIGNDISYIWDGDGQNDNALLTVFRHYDSASVVKGFVGQMPKTGWVVDYPLLERIHYLLVAGFDVYGTMGHQAITRLYMDFLRMEGENALLSFLPKNKRQEIRAGWYKGTKAEFSNYLHNPHRGLDRETGIQYTSDDPKKEFFEKILKHASKIAGPDDHINRCEGDDCLAGKAQTPEEKADRILAQVPLVRGKLVQLANDVTFVHVVTNDPEKDLAYTIIRNKILSNLSSMFNEERRRVVDEDSLTVVKGHLGSYPNAFCRINIDELEKCFDEYLKITDKLTHYNYIRKYGIRRTSPEFWEEYDWHMKHFMKAQPVEGGIFDLNRYSRIAEKKSAAIKW